MGKVQTPIEAIKLIVVIGERLSEAVSWNVGRQSLQRDRLKYDFQAKNLSFKWGRKQ